MRNCREGIGFWLQPALQPGCAVVALLECLLLGGAAAPAGGADAPPPAGRTDEAATVVQGPARVQGAGLPDRAALTGTAFILGAPGGSGLVLRFERGGRRLPEWNALLNGSSGAYGTAADSRRLELSACDLAIGGSAKLGAQWLSFGGRDGSGRRLALSLSTARLKAEGLLQSLDAGVRPGEDVAVGDRGDFQSGAGARRKELSLEYRPRSGEALALSDFSLDAASGGASRRRLSFSGRNALALAVETGSVDRRFDPAGRVSDSDRALFSRERGFRWQEFTARVRPSPWAALEATSYRSRSDAGLDERSHERWLWTFTPLKAGKLRMLRDQTEQRDPSGRSSRGTTESLQWDQTLGSGISLRAVRENTRIESAGHPAASDRQLWSLGARPQSRLQWSLDRETRHGAGGSAGELKLALRGALEKRWKFSGLYDHAIVERTGGRTSYHSEIAGPIARRVQFALSANQLIDGRGLPARKRLMTLTGAEGVLGGLFHRTRFSAALTASEDALPPAVVPPGRRLCAPRAISALPRWTRMALLGESHLGSSRLALGLQSLGLSEQKASGMTYWWRSTGQAPFQWEVRRSWLELNDGRLVLRQRLASSYQWGKSRIAAGLDVNPEPVPGQPTVGFRQSAIEFQTARGKTRLGLACGMDEILASGAQACMGRVSVETGLRSGGTLRFSFEEHGVPVSAPGPTAPPDRLLILALHQSIASDRFVDFQAQLRHWNLGAVPNDITWRLDLRTLF